MKGKFTTPVFSLRLGLILRTQLQRSRDCDEERSRKKTAAGQHGNGQH